MAEPFHTLYLDIDEVLADFVTGACEAHGVRREELEAHRTPGEWCMLNPVNKVLAKIAPEYPPLNIIEFWEEIDRKYRFWEFLRPLPWFDRVKRLWDRWYGLKFLVSSPTSYAKSWSGKVRWVEKYMGKSAVGNLILTLDKSSCSGPNRILIDDSDRNIENWKLAGGIGILFPFAGNSLHTLKDDPVGYVYEQFRSLELTHNYYPH